MEMFRCINLYDMLSVVIYSFSCSYVLKSATDPFLEHAFYASSVVYHLIFKSKQGLKLFNRRLVLLKPNAVHGSKYFYISWH